MKFEWEEIWKHSHYSNRMYIARVKVFGGWIVNTRSLFGRDINESNIFVPDTNHEWTIEKDENDEECKKHRKEIESI